MSKDIYKKGFLPDFSKINVSDIENELLKIIESMDEKIEKIISNSQSVLTWQNSIQKIDEALETLSQKWSVLSHLNNVIQTETIRNAHDKLLPIITNFYTKLGQNKKLYELYISIKNSQLYNTLSVEQKKTIENEILDFHLSGIDLPIEKQKIYLEYETKIAELSASFSNNVLDATDEFYLTIQDVERLKGLPELSIRMAKNDAVAKGVDGYVFTLKMPSYIPVMQYADDRELRKSMYLAYVTRASDVGPIPNKYDNTNIIDEELMNMHELSKLLGFNNYAELSLAKKMAENPNQVLNFLGELVNKSKIQAKEEMQDLLNFAKSKGFDEELEPWDISYYSEMQKKEKYEFSDNEIRPYFPLPKVLSGLFELFTLLFGIKVEEDTSVSVWHKDVKYYDIYSSDGILCGGVYIDLYARENKNGGAWMDGCLDRMQKIDGSIQIPIAYVVTNFTPPIDKNPSLLNHDEVETIFHEFGHAMHHVLTKVCTRAVAGINGVPWDAVELPSQFMENFTWNRKVLNMISSHYETEESIPQELIDKIINAKNYHSAVAMLRQLEFALFDFKLFYGYQQGIKAQKVLDEVRKEVSVVPISSLNRFQNSFTHIFSGGYSAGYYSYKWAEVLSSDIFSKFDDKGGISREVGQSFLEKILQKGGTEDFMKMFVDFMGRKPKIDALLNYSGIKVNK